MGELVSGSFGNTSQQACRVEVVTQSSEIAVHAIRVRDEQAAKTAAIEIASRYSGSKAVFICEGEPATVRWALKGNDLLKHVAILRGRSEAV